MMLSFWYGLILFISCGILIIFLFSFIAKKLNRNAGLAGILGFFTGVGFVFLMLFTAGRFYVVTGDAEFEDYLVYGTPSYKLASGNELELDIPAMTSMVLNDWDSTVVVEYVIYGGYGFGGDTDFIKAGELKLFDESRIFYFYDDGPPDEISVKTDAKEVTRLWLRNKR